VLTRLEKINDLEEHNVKQFGLVVSGKVKQGVLLPDLDNIKTANQQLKVCLKKGSLKDSDTSELFRFEVKRFTLYKPYLLHFDIRYKLGYPSPL
jgi:AMMECR1 domain-containing protein